MTSIDSNYIKKCCFLDSWVMFSISAWPPYTCAKSQHELAAKNVSLAYVYTTVCTRSSPPPPPPAKRNISSASIHESGVEVGSSKLQYFSLGAADVRSKGWGGDSGWVIKKKGSRESGFEGWKEDKRWAPLCCVARRRRLVVQMNASTI